MIVLRRIVETVAVMLISSLPFYFLAAYEIIPSQIIFYLLCFGTSAVVFLILSYICLRAHMLKVENTFDYFVMNMPLFIIQGLVNLYGLEYFSGDLYTALFGYTKPLRIFGVSPLYSAFVFYVLYFVVIVFVPVCRKIAQHRAKREVAELIEAGAIDIENPINEK